MYLVLALYNTCVREELIVPWHTERTEAQLLEIIPILKPDQPVVGCYSSDGEPLGFATLTSSPWDYDGRRYTAYFEVYVPRKYRRRGVATELWNRLRLHEITEANKIYTVIADSPAITDVPATQFLSSIGFNKCLE